MSVLLCCENNNEWFEGESGSEYRQVFMEGLETFKSYSRKFWKWPLYHLAIYLWFPKQRLKRTYMVQPRLIKMYASACVVLKPPIQEGEMKISMHFFSGAVGLYVFGIVDLRVSLTRWGYFIFIMMTLHYIRLGKYYFVVREIFSTIILWKYYSRNEGPQINTRLTFLFRTSLTSSRYEINLYFSNQPQIGHLLYQNIY